MNEQQIKTLELQKWFCMYVMDLAESGLMKVKPGEAEKVRRICARAAAAIEDEIFDLRREEIENRIKELQNA